MESSLVAQNINLILRLDYIWWRTAYVLVGRTTRVNSLVISGDIPELAIVQPI